MFNKVSKFLHVLIHPFTQRVLVFEMIVGGGVQYYLGCYSCGELEPIDRYVALDLMQWRGMIHVDEFRENLE